MVQAIRANEEIEQRNREANFLLVPFCNRTL